MAELATSTINIRKLEVRDREAVRQITHDAAFMGEPASLFFDGDKIISDALTLYFTDYEPQSCFVAEAGGALAGCLLGAKDKVASEKIISEKIAMPMLREALASGILFRKKNLVFLFSALAGMIRGEFKMPDFNLAYPATFHINLRKEFRGRNIGSGLIAAYLNYLKAEKVSGVHLATMSQGAGEFFSKQGFELLFSGKRSYFRHILHKDVPLDIYGKKL